MSGFFQKLRSFFGSKDREEPEAAHPATVVTEVEVAPQPSAEELCGITSGMGMEEIRQLLAKLYKRYNHSASSLEMDRQAEAEQMLDAIVDCREKYLSD